jgi:DNA-binding NtrC family response regulator
VKRILVVDDEKQMVRTLCDILRVHGWEADGRFDGESGVEAVRDTAYDVVLMDIKMTGMNGVEALREMRALRPRIRVILMTAYASRELLEQAVVEGALEILSKPVPLPLLTGKLESALTNGVPILVVDDDREYLSTLGDILTKKGYKALEAASLEEALRVLEKNEPVAAVLDLRLNHVEPSEVVLAIRRLSPAVALILYSGYPKLLDDTTSELPPGFVHAALHKPFQPDQLLELLDGIARN